MRTKDRGRTGGRSSASAQKKLYAVKFLFGEAVDAIENLLIYSNKPAILEMNENERLRAGEINNSRMPLKEQLDSPP